MGVGCELLSEEGGDNLSDGLVLFVGEADGDNLF